MTCKDCIHYDVCLLHEDNFIEDAKKNGFCGKFKNKYDVVEVKHGYWMDYPSDSYMKCSVCGMEYIKSQMPKIVGYCPNPECGAKMKIKF